MVKKYFNLPSSITESLKNIELIHTSQHVNAKFLLTYLSKSIVSVRHYNEFFKTNEILEFLNKNGEVIEISETKSLDNKNIDRLIFNGEEFIDSDKSYLYFYKNNIIRVSINEELEINSNKKESCKITFYFPSNEECLDKEFLPFINNSKDPRIFMLNQEYGDFVFSKFTINLPKTFDLELNYGKDFVKISKKIVESLTSNHSGLYMFHGPPGTGKSTYIKYLASELSKDVIFFPTSMIGNITSPDIINLLIKKQNCILILEDAEKAIIKRDSNSESSLVSTLLNMTDGILGDVLKLNVIVTYNCKRSDIDEALLRKGRLKAEHSFNHLSIENSNKLLNKIGIKVKVDSEMTLADIYNYKKDDDLIGNKESLLEKPRIGFVT